MATFYRCLTVVLSLLVGSPAVAGILSDRLEERIRINGYSSFEYEYQISDEGRGDSNGSFDADLFDLVLNVLIADNFRVSADISWEHGTATEDDFGNVAVEYAFAEYAVRDLLKVRAGKMLTAFGIYNEIHTAKPVTLTVKEPLSTNKNDKFGSDLRFYPRWGTGLAVLGNGIVSDMEFDYVLQLTNGDTKTTNPYEEDDNEQKALTGRFRIFPLEGLELGVSFYSDSLNELDDEGEETGKRTDLYSVGGQLVWLKSNVRLELEYVYGTIDPSTGDDIDRYGLTAMISYTFRDRYTPYFRYEYLEPNDDVDDDVATMYVYGVNVRILEGFFVKMELNTIDADRHNDRFKDGRGNYTEFKAAVAVGF